MENRLEMYTPEQRRAIEHKKGNLIVSASAGTGKTAVLTERILNLILDKENPCDIDEMAVVTFTKAAAAEMKERTLAKFNEILEAEPENEHIRKQTALTAHAQISTIDSLCMGIVRDYFYIIDLDPAFRIGDEQEIKLLKNDILDEVIEEAFLSKSLSFRRMVDMLVPKGKISALNEHILHLYNMAESHPDPVAWLMGCKKQYDLGDSGNIDELGWLEGTGILEHARACVSHAVNSYDMLISDCGRFTEFDKLTDMLERERCMVAGLLNCTTYTEYSERISEAACSFERFPRISSKDDVIIRKKDDIKAVRTQLKESIQKLGKNYFNKTADEVCEELKRCAPVINELIDVTIKFRESFYEEKRLLNIADFSDVEHMALNILTAKDSYAADELRERYKYILVDEYQDINEVQDRLIYYLSRESIGEPNIFMVGDVKQSIYRFRLARPEIFEEKRRLYTGENPNYQRIMLRNNFRSSKSILGMVNEMFSEIMNDWLGGVDYNEDHAFSFENDDKPSYEPEAVYVVKNGADISDVGKKKIEALVVAEKIFELLDAENGIDIFDKERKCYRKADFGDVAILFRSMSGWAEEFAEVLRGRGIPVITEERTGYFSAREVRTAIAMLKIIDNPNQDIPLVTVMKSVYGGFNDDELARIRAYEKRCNMYRAVKSVSEYEDGRDLPLTKKCIFFMNKLNTLRKEAPYISVYELIEKIYELDNFIYYMEALPLGDRRVGNLRMLARQAISFENTEKRSLYDFLKYIEKMQKADIDLGEAEEGMSAGGAVRIMSIHKSKGLEFPVTFVSGMGKKFNRQDANAGVVINSDLGIGIDYINPDTRVRSKTLIKKAMAQKIINDGLGEELRVLYVAFTRPREKLIITGFADEDKNISAKGKNAVSYYGMVKAETYFDWITPFILKKMKYEIKFSEDYIISEETEAVNLGRLRKELADIAKEPVNADVAAEAEKIRGYIYPYMPATKYPVKMSVTELKRRSESINSITDNETYGGEECAPWTTGERQETIPAFAKEQKAHEDVSGAARGTVYHSVMEHIVIKEINSLSDVADYVKRLIDRGIAAENVLDDNIVNCKKILKFCKSIMGQRMGKAQEEGKLYKEQPFIMGVSASELYPDTDSSEIILVQGIIDAFFEEDDKIVLLDYKTDYIKPGQENELLDKYRTQLLLYKRAIEKTNDLPVGEMVIYSFALDKELLL